MKTYTKIFTATRGCVRGRNKMKRYSLFFILVSLFTLSSCADKKEVLNLSRVKESKLQLEEISFDVPSLFPKGCCVKDSFLIVFNPKDKEGFLYIYDKGDKTFLKKYGTIGEGPDDFKNPRFLFNDNLLPSKNTLLIGDGTRLYAVNIDAILNSSGKAHDVLTEIPGNLRLYNYLLHNNDSMLVVNQTGEHQLTFYNKRTKTTDLKNYFEKNGILKDASDFCRAMQIYDAYYSSNRERIAIAYKHWKQIDILSASGDLIKQIYFPDYDYNRGKMSLDGESLRLGEDARMFFSFIYPTNDFFYALCWDNTKTNIKQGSARASIYQFNWEGELKEIFRLDKAVSYFCIDSSGMLYAVGISEDNLDLIIYSSTLK